MSYNLFQKVESVREKRKKKSPNPLLIICYVLDPVNDLLHMDLSILSGYNISKMTQRIEPN